MGERRMRVEYGLEFGDERAVGLLEFDELCEGIKKGIVSSFLFLR